MYVEIPEQDTEPYTLHSITFLNTGQVIMTESPWNIHDLHPVLVDVQKSASAEIKFYT